MAGHTRNTVSRSEVIEKPILLEVARFNGAFLEVRNGGVLPKMIETDYSK
jgi:hypothetical protein